MPCDSAASASMPVSGMLGMNAAARSPGRRPSWAIACAARDTSLVSCGVADAPLEAALVPEHESVALVAAPSRFSAKFRRASGNHFAPGILSPSTSTVLPFFEATTPHQSQTSDQNSSGLSTVHW